MINRRHLLVGGALGLGAANLPASLLAAGRHRWPGRGGSGANGAIPVQQVGTIVGNDPADLDRWDRWLGHKPNHVLLAFDQSSWDSLDKSVSFIVGVGRQMMARGVRIQWSVPIGGWMKYEDVRDGKSDALYKRIATEILAATPPSAGRICIRPPWEFNGDFQSQRAKSWKGAWDGELYKTVYRRIASAFRAASPRFYFDWCPNIGTEGYNPELCYPGDDLVDVVSVDVYYRTKYDDKGQNDAGRSMFNYRKTEPNGLDWLTRFATAHGKLIGISEWGVDDDRATAFMQGMVDWMKALGPRLSHQNYWDRSDGDADTVLSTGKSPHLGAIYKAAFA